MTIVKKTIIAVCVVSLALLTSLYFISNAIYLKGFDKIESQTVEKNVHRVTEAIAAKVDALNTFCYDWADWDDTYDFARGYNQEFVDRNFQDETFSSSDINIIAILDTSGKMVYGKAYDFADSMEIAFPDDFMDIVAAQGLVNPADMDSGVSGIINISGQPTLIASRQILNSLSEGPTTGTIIMGRFLNTTVLSDLATTTHLPITLAPSATVQSNPDLKGVAALLNTAASVYVRAENNGYIAGYTFINDITGNPTLLVKIEMIRDIHAQGVKVIGLLRLSSLVIGIIFCVAFIILMYKILLTRLTALKNNVNKIGSMGDLSVRIPVIGKDELSKLTGNINNMLESLEKSEIKRRSQKELLGHIIANTPNAVLATNESEQILLANRAFERIFGADEAGIIGQQFDSLVQLGNIIPEFRAFLDSGSMNLKKELQYNYQGRKKTIIASFTRASEDVDKLFFMILTDVTEERAKQERLYLTDRLVSVGEMASGIAHELNNPLTSVIGLSEVLAEEDVPAQMKEDLSAINTEAKRAAVIVKNMLSFARKRLSLKQCTQINRVVEDVLKLRGHEQSLNHINIVPNLAPDLPEINVDFFQIQQVFINIVLNAEQAMVEAHGKGTLTITSEKVDDIIRVTFVDDGPGIDKEHLNRIFDPFFTTKEVGKGTGLGLSISYGIITAHHGLIYAKSETGKGATFVVELPVQTENTEEI